LKSGGTHEEQVALLQSDLIFLLSNVDKPCIYSHWTAVEVSVTALSYHI